MHNSVKICKIKWRNAEKLEDMQNDVNTVYAE